MSLRFALMLVVALAALVAAGCGGDASSGPVESSGAPSAEEWVQQADEICAQGNQELDQSAQKAFGEGPPSPEEQEQFVTETVVPSLQAQIDEVGGLDRPEGSDGDRVAAFLDTAQREYDTFAENPAAAEARGNPFAESEQLGSELGLQDCVA